MPVMHTAIPCTGSTADQAVSTVHVQLSAGEAPILDLCVDNTVVLTIVSLKYTVPVEYSA